MRQGIPLCQHARSLIDELRGRTAIVGVLGLGCVGLLLLLRFSEAGLRSIGFDVDSAKVAILSRGESCIATVARDRIAHALRAGMRATHDYSSAREADAIAICVPTSLGHRASRI